MSDDFFRVHVHGHDVPAICPDCRQPLRYRGMADMFTCGCPARERSILAIYADDGYPYKFSPSLPARPEQIPGYVWIGQYAWRDGRFVWADGYYERIASPEPHRELPRTQQPLVRVPPIVWLILGVLFLIWLVRG